MIIQIENHTDLNILIDTMKKQFDDSQIPLSPCEDKAQAWFETSIFASSARKAILMYMEDVYNKVDIEQKTLPFHERTKDQRNLWLFIDSIMERLENIFGFTVKW
jgi:hypothetical protein